MDRLRVGRSIRAIRVRLGWRQSDLAGKAGVSRTFVSKMERGLLVQSSLRALEHVCAALGAELDVRLRWRGEGLDRLLDEAHAVLVDRTVELLRAAGWEVALEVTFNHFGDRGSVDVLGWRRETRSLLVVEIKSVVPDAQGTLMPLDRKSRLGAVIGAKRGWRPAIVSRLLVVGDRTVNRRRVAALASLFDAALPLRGHDVRRWLRSPAGRMAGLLFLSDVPRGVVRRASAGRLRVNPSRKRQSDAG